VTATGLAIRLTWVFAYKNPVALRGDGWYYHNAANLLADGRGFIQPALLLLYYTHRVVQAAEHPPGYIVALAASSVVGLRSALAHQIWSCLLGTATIVVVGQIGRMVAGLRAGLTAALIAAVSPVFWVNDGLVMSETLAILTAAVTVMLAYAFWRRPSAWLAVALGLAGAVFALTRAEALLILPLVVVGAPLLFTVGSVRRRFALAGVAGAAALVALAPWVAYNQSRFRHPVLISYGLGWAMAGANCDLTYHGEFQGYSMYACGTAAPGSGAVATKGRTRASADDLSGLDASYRRQALRYVRKHVSQLPVVVLARVGRTFGLYKPRQQLKLDEYESGRQVGPGTIGLLMFYVLAPVAIFGAVVLRRRSVPIFPLVSLVVMVIAAAALTSGQTRYRAPAEVAVAVLAAAGADAIVQRVRREPEQSA
jgi:4-amino-4-deoxy-L-arabinose transferase-like glycosyltransferase